MDLDNKSLAVIITFSIFISLGSVLYSTHLLEDFTKVEPIVGRGTTDQGNARVEIQNATSIIVLDPQIVDFGAGYVEDTDYCNMSSEEPTAIDNASVGVGGECDTGDWADDELESCGSCRHGLVLENDGNVNVTVRLGADQNTSTFICADDATCTAADPHYMFKINNTDSTTVNGTDGRAGGCAGNIYNETWSEVPFDLTPADAPLICDNMFSGNTADRFEIEIFLSIPKSAPPGVRQSVLTFTAEVV